MNNEEREIKYQVSNNEYWKLSAWKEIARWEITKWLFLDGYADEIDRTTMKNEYMGPFTKFLYHFAFSCMAGWGTMVDFNEYRQRVFLCDKYYKWMHELRDEILESLSE